MNRPAITMTTMYSQNGSAQVTWAFSTTTNTSILVDATRYHQADLNISSLSDLFLGSD
jgi:hypothetical protein